MPKFLCNICPQEEAGGKMEKHCTSLRVLDAGCRLNSFSLRPLTIMPGSVDVVARMHLQCHQDRGIL
jgi:hypothetical protein